MDTSTKALLKRLVDQIERLEEEKTGIAADIKDKYVEAKSLGFDAKILRKVIALRKRDKAEREADDAVLETYMHALGMLADTPLGQWAVDRKSQGAGERVEEAA